MDDRYELHAKVGVECLSETDRFIEIKNKLERSNNSPEERKTLEKELRKIEEETSNLFNYLMTV